MNEQEHPSVLVDLTPKNLLVQGFLLEYAAQFDAGADTRELYTDVITDIIHVLSRDLERDGEDPGGEIANDTQYLDHIDDVLALATGHYDAETTYRVGGASAPVGT